MGDNYEASVISNPNNISSIGLAGRYDVKCHDVDGNLKWEDTIENRVVNSGIGMSLNGALANQAQGSVFIGLLAGSAAFTITATTSLSDIVTGPNGELTSGYKLNTSTGAQTRGTPTFTPLTISTSSTSISPTTAQVFYMTASATVYGCFLVTGSGASSAWANTGGFLFSAGNFTASKQVQSGDSLSVTYQAQGTSV